MHIFAHKPHVGEHGTAINVVLAHAYKRISIACDDSCGAMERLSRSDIRLLDGKKDVTGEVMGADAEANCCVTDKESFLKVVNWLLNEGD